MMNLKSQLEQLISGSFMEEMIRIRRHLHRFPELSFQEHKTSEYIRGLLDSWRIQYTFPWVKTGILAWITGGKPGPVIALRTDMDALPLTEQTGSGFESENPGVMHACGHDLHMASMLGAIRVLDQMKEEVAGEILFVFQPGEEKVPGGARLMMEEGIFRERTPVMIIAQHVLPEMDAGHVGFRGGTYMASSDEIYLTVHGRGGHGAMPRDIADPILMAAHILISLQQEIHRKAPSGTPTVLSFGKVIADGAVNVIPDQVRLEGTFRTMNENWRKEAHHLIGQIAGGIASSMGGSCQLEIGHGYPVLRNHEGITNEAIRCASQLLGPDKVEEMDIRMTAEDFAWFTQSIPGMMFRLGVREPGSSEVFPLHTTGFRVDETALKTGISMLSCLAVELLNTASV